MVHVISVHGCCIAPRGISWRESLHPSHEDPKYIFLFCNFKLLICYHSMIMNHMNRANPRQIDARYEMEKLCKSMLQLNVNSPFARRDPMWYIVEEIVQQKHIYNVLDYMEQIRGRYVGGKQ